MGAALAILMAAEDPAAVSSLVLFGPAGLPMTKPITRSLMTFTTEIAHRRFPVDYALTGARDLEKQGKTTKVDRFGGTAPGPQH